MLTSAITAAIVAVLTFLGVEPGPYVAGVWIGVKVVIVLTISYIGWRVVKKRNKAAEGTGAPPPAPPES